MKQYSQEELDGLVSCPKRITEVARKELRLDRGSFRNDMDVISCDGTSNFTVFMRQNEQFPENFCIGLVYHPTEDPATVTLLRCNGPHGEFLSSVALPDTHAVPHIHRAKAGNIEIGVKPERGGEPTDQYISYEQALQHFLRAVNIGNAEDFFPPPKRMLWDPDSEGEPS